MKGHQAFNRDTRTCSTADFTVDIIVDSSIQVLAQDAIIHLSSFFVNGEGHLEDAKDERELKVRQKDPCHTASRSPQRVKWHTKKSVTPATRQPNTKVLRHELRNMSANEVNVKLQP